MSSFPQVAADHTGLVDETASVAAVEPKERHQVVEVDVLLDDHLLPWRRSPALQLPRILLEASDKLEELVTQRRVFVHAKRKGMVRPRAMNVHYHLGVGVAGDVVEVNRWVGFPESSCGAGCGSQIRFQPDGLGDPQQLSLLLEH
jgi:hypothetical protein